MASRFRDRATDERGVVLVMVAILMVVILGAAALAVDLGSFYKAQRQAQSAADAAALAAAQVLPSATAASTTGTSYVTQNYPGATATVSVNTTVNQATVTVNANTPSFFGKALGLTKEKVTARAVASQTGITAQCSTPGTGCFAIFAMDQNCSDTGINITGGGNHIQGGIHSNSGINTGGGGSSYGPTTYGPTASGCKATTGGGDTFTSGPTSEAPITTWPIDYSKQFTACSGSACTGPNGTPSYCTKAAASFTFSSSSQPVPNNIYCAYGAGTPSNPATYTGSIAFTGGGYGSASNPIAASFIAGSVSANSGGMYLEAENWPTNKLIFYVVGTGTAVNLGGGSNLWEGDFFVPNGTISITAGSQETNFLEAQDVNLSPGGLLFGDGPPDTGTSTSSSVESLLQ